MKNRLFNKLYAQAFGYFWLPCPICGQEFGGHEWGSGAAGIPKDGHGTWYGGTSTGVCPDCAPTVIIIRRLIQMGKFDPSYITPPQQP